MTADPIEWSDTVATFAELQPPAIASPAPEPMSRSPDVPQPEADDAWIERCRTRILALDANLPPEHATLFARLMSRRPCWRDEVPERVADRVIRPLRLVP